MDNIPVNFLQLFPVTEEEMRYKLGHGPDAMIELLLEKDPPIVFDPYRESMV